jgi:hypothetical protein
MEWAKKNEGINNDIRLKHIGSNLSGKFVPRKKLRYDVL